MAKYSAIANLIEYDDDGRSTARPVRLNARLCAGEDPQRFEILLPEIKRTKHNRAITFTRAEIERVLRAIP